MKGSIAGWGRAPSSRHHDLAQTPLGSHFFPDDQIQCLFTSSGIFKPAHPYLSALHPSQCLNLHSSFSVDSGFTSTDN